MHRALPDHVRSDLASTYRFAGLASGHRAEALLEGVEPVSLALARSAVRVSTP